MWKCNDGPAGWQDHPNASVRTRALVGGPGAVRNHRPPVACTLPGNSPRDAGKYEARRQRLKRRAGCRLARLQKLTAGETLAEFDKSRIEQYPDLADTLSNSQMLVQESDGDHEGSCSTPVSCNLVCPGWRRGGRLHEHDADFRARKRSVQGATGNHVRSRFVHSAPSFSGDGREGVTVNLYRTGDRIE